jgi:pyridoxamine 5'-phosphate oxidase
MVHDSRMSDRFDKLRAEYRGRGLEGALPERPLELLDEWLRDAEPLPLSNAMALATERDGQPTCRMVLLKNIDERGRLWFFTGYESAKGRELAANPRAALLFYWEPLHRQVRITGAVERLSAADSDAYFAERPRPSNLAAMTSNQSAVIDRGDGGLEQLARELRETTSAWDGRELERPESWGGFGLTPASFEFWQGKQDRLHHRVRYIDGGDGGGWRREWLYP